MGLFFADLVRERSTATGTGAFTLEGALPGHRRFAAAVPAGARFHYAISGVTRPDEWETGEGEVDGSGALLRSPLASSTGGAAVAFSPGLKTVALTVTAQWFSDRDGQPALDQVEGLQAALAAKQPASPPLAALGGLDPGAGTIPYFTGAETAALASATVFGRGLLAAADGAALREALELGAEARFGGSLSVGTVERVGAVTAAGGTTFTVPPAYGTVSFGKIMHSSGWAGSGLVCANSLAGSKAFSIVCNVDTAFFGFLDAASSQWSIMLTETQADFFGAVTMSSAGVSIAGSPVVGARRAGWGAPTGTATRAGFNTAGVTTAELAERVKGLIDDLSAHGLIGA